MQVLQAYLEADEATIKARCSGQAYQVNALTLGPSSGPTGHLAMHAECLSVNQFPIPVYCTVLDLPSTSTLHRL